ncbi:MAG: hypothetical protein ACRDZY_06480 [Acidimicrobiales bacterium]
MTTIAGPERGREMQAEDGFESPAVPDGSDQTLWALAKDGDVAAFGPNARWRWWSS